MRLSIAIPAVTGGLALTGAAITLATASPPPVAPIIYCPAGAAAPAKAAPKAAPAPTPVAAHVRRACPTVRHVGYAHPRFESHVERRVARAERPWRNDNDVSASQAFIYRYERAEGGLDARAAHEAWAEGGAPQRWRRDVQVEIVRAPPAPPHIFVERTPAGSPPPQMRPHWDHAPPPVAEERPPIRLERPGPPPQAPAEHAYAWTGDHAAGAQAGVRVERRVEEHASGWRYADVDGQRHVEHWSDGDRGADRDGYAGERREEVIQRGGAVRGGYAERSESYRQASARPCPPRPDTPCALAARESSYTVYHVAGRDAHGYLVWPGKTPE